MDALRPDPASDAGDDDLRELARLLLRLARQGRRPRRARDAAPPDAPVRR